MDTLLLSYRDLQEIVRRIGIDPLMDQMIDRLASALVSFDPKQTEIPVRTGFHYESPVTGLIEWMPLLQRRSKVLMKMVGYHPQSPDSLNLPTILSTLSLYDTTTGHLTALVDGTFLTALRTGAASAVASRLLAKPDSTTLGLIGCGAQAVTQLHAIGRLFDLEHVLIFDIDSSAMETFPARVAGFVSDRTDIRAVPIESLIETADILCVATSVEVGQGPVFEYCATKPWLHVNAVGSDFPGKTELPKPLLFNSFVCPDNLCQAECEGECQQLTADQIGEDLVAVASRANEFSTKRWRCTVFDSTGWALEDLVAVELLLDHASRFELGCRLQLEGINQDPRHPYEFLTSSPGHVMPQEALEIESGA